jgi:cytochrome c oxidase cbb3-type subunit 2
VASLVFALSGWVCSGLGIGMAQNLRHVPWLFVLAAALLLGAPILVRWFYGARREFAYASLVFVTALTWPIFTRAVPEPQDRIARGRAVYISEGCINCHSQYVKPGSRDELLWGPVRPIEDSLREAPPLFGNRRQGPDLMNVGNRRSRDWLKAHFISPRVLSKGSSMPSYEYLFSDDRGEALVEYLLSLGAGESRWDLIQNWSLGTTNDGSIPASHGRDLFRQHCAMCHGQVSGSPGAMANAFRKAPPDLAQGPFTFAPPALPAPLRQAVLARIIKFGLPGTDMPGHEYLADRDLFALMQYVEQCSQKR